MGSSLLLPLKGATKSYFMYYSRVVIIFFRTGLEVCIFYLFIWFVFLFYFFVFVSLFCTVLNSMSSLLGKVSQVIKIDHVLFKFVFTLSRSGHRRWFINKAVRKNFAIFIWKHLKRLQQQVFYCHYCESFKNTYFEEHLPTADSVYSNDLLI